MGVGQANEAEVVAVKTANNVITPSIKRNALTFMSRPSFRIYLSGHVRYPYV